MAQLNDRQKRQLVDEGYDLGFISRTQPHGNIKIHPGYIEEGNSCVAFVDIYKYPSANMPAFWLSNLVNQKHVIALLSVTTQNTASVKPALDRSITNLKASIADPNTRPLKGIGDTIDATSLIRTYRSLKNNSETLKRIRLRLLVYADTLPHLLTRIRDIQDGFPFKMTRCINEQQYDLRSMYLPMTLQSSLPNRRKGTIIQSYDLGGSYMFNYVNLHDPGGKYFGFTQTDGAFVFNPYNLRGKRTRVFSLVAGTAGMGKSTFLKMLNDDAFMRGHYIRNFDVTGEYRRSVAHQHGIIINTSKKDSKNRQLNRVNMFQIFPTVANDDGSINIVLSFDNNVNKIMAISHIMNPNLTSDELSLLKHYITGFYISNNMWSHDPSHHLKELPIFVKTEQYPTLIEFVNYLEDQVSALTDDTHHHDAKELEQTKNLYRAFENMYENYGDMFNGHTNVPDFSKEQVVDFDMRAAADASAGMNANLFQAQFFSYLSMVSAQMIKNGRHYRQLEAEGKLVDDKLGRNVKYYYINIDEAEDYFNPKYPDVVQMIASMMEQMRKNYCAITLAFPTLKDILLNDADQISQYEDYNDAVERIFGLIQYFHFFQLEGADLKALTGFFQRNQSVSVEQLSTLPQLNPRQLLTIIVGDRSYEWETEVSDGALARYRG